MNQRAKGNCFWSGRQDVSAQVVLKQSCIQFILIAQSIRMQSPLQPHQKICFNNGKTFILPPAAFPASNSPLLLLQSQSRSQFHRILPEQSSYNQQILWNSHPLEQRLPQMFTTPSMMISSYNQGLNVSQGPLQTLRNLKDSNRSSSSNFAQLSSDIHLHKKNKIFQPNNAERGAINGKEADNNFNVRFFHPHDTNRKVAFGQQKEEGINFGRKECESSQQIASYFRMKRPNAIKTQLFTPDRQFRTEAQRSQSTRCIKRLASTSLDSFKRLPQTHTNIDLEGRTSKERNDQDHQQTHQHGRYQRTFRNTKHIIKEVKIKRKNEKDQHPLKASLNIFCEQSTIKIKRQPQENHISVSNIQEDNSFSRYYDQKDDLLPLLNKISYQNVQIQKKSQASEDQIVTPNIFMDFDKVTSPHIHRKQHRQIVHFECTQQSKILNQSTIATQPKSLLSNLAPICLILITITLLVIQSIF